MAADTPLYWPRDVRVSPVRQDPDDPQRVWALGRGSDGAPVFLTTFHSDPDNWRCNWLGEVVSGFGVTPARVRLWADMLDDAGWR